MKVAIYTRVSTEDQAREGFSLDVQRNFLLQYAKTYDWTVFCSIDNAEVYQDDGFTGSNTDRPALQKLITDAQRKKFDLVVVYKQDRLSRKLKDLLSLLENFENLGIGYKSATEPFDTTTSAGKMAIQMLGSYAEFERNRLIERVFPGMVEAVKKGHRPGSRYVPYGYTHNKETKKLEVHPEESKVIKEIYQMYLRGKSTAQIAKHYLDIGVKSRSGGMFQKKTVGDILKSKVYIGSIVWNKSKYCPKTKTKNGQGKGYRSIKNPPSEIIETPNAHEAIVSHEDFNTVQKILAMKRKNNTVRFKNTIYHLSGVLRCDICGSSYCGKMVMTNKARNLKKPWYYCMSKTVRLTKCENKAVTADAINEQVWKVIDTICQNIHILDELGDLIKMAATEPEELYMEQLEEKEKLYHKKLEKQRVLFELFDEDKINVDVYREKSAKLGVEEKRLKSEIKLLQLKILDKRNSINLMQDTQEFLVQLNRRCHNGDMDFALKNFMRIIFKGIYIRNQKIVRLDIHQPWKLCYEKGLECKKQRKAPKELQKMTATGVSSIWKPTDDRWSQYCVKLVEHLMLCV